MNTITIKRLVLSSIICLSLGSLSACSSVAPFANTTQSGQTQHSTDAFAHLKLNTSAMMSHLQAFEKIAQDNDGNRAVGTQGGRASAAYIVNQAKKSGYTVQMLAFENRKKIVGQNIIVEIPGQSKDTAVLIGAHYDSVKMGPGINDNASGVALGLELMHQLAEQKIQAKHTIYLAFWDSEETGIAGSQDYVQKLSAEQLKGIQAYINIDMVGTQNPEVLIADADKSSLDEMEKMLRDKGMDEADFKPLLDSLRALPSHAGDVALENQLKHFLQQKNLKIKEDVSSLTASDTLPFLGKVPVAAITMFNEQMKGDELEFAPCYHRACDTLDLIDPQSLQWAGEAVIDLLSHLNKS